MSQTTRHWCLLVAGSARTSDPNTSCATGEITGLYGSMLKRFIKRKFGEVPAPLGAMWHNRPVLKALFGLGRKADKWHACDRELKSFAHLAASSMVGCSARLDFGYLQAHNEELNLEKARGATLARVEGLHGFGARRAGIPQRPYPRRRR